MVLLEFVAFHQVAARQFLLSLRVLRDHTDTVAGCGIDQVEADRSAIMLGVVERHGTGHERQTEVPTPDRPLCHQRMPEEGGCGNVKEIGMPNRSAEASAMGR